MGKSAPQNVAPPTIGRMVYLYGGDSYNGAKPFVGIVADVGVGGNPLTINCAAIANSGDDILGGLQGVRHVSDAMASSSRVYWDWMDFQKGQQAKTEELEKKLEAKSGG